MSSMRISLDPGDPNCLHCAVAATIGRWYLERNKDLDPREIIYRLTELLGEVVNASPDVERQAVFARKALDDAIANRADVPSAPPVIRGH